jgi:hypothetical protein
MRTNPKMYIEKPKKNDVFLMLIIDRTLLLGHVSTVHALVGKGGGVNITPSNDSIVWVS